MFDFPESGDGIVATRSIGYLVRRAFKLMSQQAEQVFEGHALTLSQWVVLKLTDEGRIATPGEAARTLGHNTGATTRLIDELERQGLLQRSRESGDRRVVRLTLTPAGESVIRAWDGEMRRFHDEMLAEFSADEVTVLLGLMGRLVDRLEARDTS